MTKKYTLAIAPVVLLTMTMGAIAGATEETKLKADLDGVKGDLFGWSVSVYGDTCNWCGQHMDAAS